MVIMNIMFLNNLNRKNKRLYKRFCTALNISQSNQNHLKAFMNYLKDINNNTDFERWYFKNANNKKVLNFLKKRRQFLADEAMRMIVSKEVA